MNMQTRTVKDGRPAVLKNVLNMMTLIETIRQRPERSSGFGLFYGPSGYGKTVASTYAQNEDNCLYIEVREFWTRKDFCIAFLQELGQKPVGTISQMMREIIGSLGNDPDRAVIIDEADKLVDRNMIELARDLQEMTHAPVVLVGEERLKAKLDRYERCASRVLDEVKAVPCDVDDARELASALAPDIVITDDLLAATCLRARGSTRRVANGLYDIATFARSRGLEEVSARAYTPQSASEKYAQAREVRS